MIWASLILDVVLVVAACLNIWALRVNRRIRRALEQAYDQVDDRLGELDEIVLHTSARLAILNEPRRIFEPPVV